MTDGYNPWIGSKEKPGYLAYIIVAVAIIGVILMVRSSSSRTRVSTKLPKRGDVAVITARAFCGFTQQGIDEITRRSTASDGAGIQQLIKSGQAGTLDAGQKVKIISSGILTMEVSPMTPPNQGRSCFVASDFVKLETSE